MKALFPVLCLLTSVLAPAALHAHALTITQVLVLFREPGRADVRVDLDLTPWLGPEAYQALSRDNAAAQRAAVEKLLPDIRARVAVPCLLVIAVIGLGWAGQRIIYYCL